MAGDEADPAFQLNPENGGETPVDGGALVPDPELDGGSQRCRQRGRPRLDRPADHGGAPPAITKLAVGDSVMLGAAAQLAELGFTVDATESRAWVNGLDFVETLGSQDRLPETMIIHLGTNGPIGQANMDRMMAAVSTVPDGVAGDERRRP